MTFDGLKNRQTLAPTRFLTRLLHGSSSKKKEKSAKTTVNCQQRQSNSVAPHQNGPSNGFSNNVDQILDLDDINSPTAFVAAITAKQRALRGQPEVPPSTSHESSPQQNGQIPSAEPSNQYRTFQKESQHYFQEPPNWNPNRFRQDSSTPSVKPDHPLPAPTSSAAANSDPNKSGPKKKPMLQSDVAL